MAYSDHFRLADELIAHLSPTVTALHDPFLQSRYTGFVSVAAVTVYELAVKEILCSFAESKHKVLGAFARSFFERLNGRIQYKQIHDDYVMRFGEKYSKKFKKHVSTREQAVLASHRKSILSNYNNIIVWRHAFAHQGQLPANATFQDAIDAYDLGKNIVVCLADSMTR